MNILYVRNLTFSFFSSNLAQVFYVVKRIESKLSTVLIERLEPSEYFSFLNYISPKIYRIHCAKYFRNQLPIAHQRSCIRIVRVCVLGFSAGKSELAIRQRPNGLTKISNVFYTVLATGFIFLLFSFVSQLSKLVILKQLKAQLNKSEYFLCPQDLFL